MATNQQVVSLSGHTSFTIISSARVPKSSSTPAMTPCIESTQLLLLQAAESLAGLVALQLAQVRPAQPAAERVQQHKVSTFHSFQTTLSLDDNGLYRFRVVWQSLLDFWKTRGSGLSAKVETPLKRSCILSLVCFKLCLCLVFQPTVHCTDFEVHKPLRCTVSAQKASFGKLLIPSASTAIYKHLMLYRLNPSDAVHYSVHECYISLASNF